jgi:hypothetical protein
MGLDWQVLGPNSDMPSKKICMWKEEGREMDWFYKIRDMQNYTGKILFWLSL